MFPAALREFAMLYREPKVESIPEEDVADVSCSNLGNSYNTLRRKNEQLFHSEPNGHGMYYTKIMAELARRQSESGSPHIHTTQQKYIGVFLMVYFGYLKETLAKDFGQEPDSTRRQIDEKGATLLWMGTVPETEENKRKLMVYDIEDNFPISECLQKENIKMIPANTQFAVVSMTRYYVKTCYFQALEDIYCLLIWHHVVESIYETDSLLEYSSNVDIMDIDFTLKSYKSFKVAFNNYMLNMFPLTYTSHPDEKYGFPLHLKQGGCSIVLTNRLVLHSGVLPAFETFVDAAKEPTRHSTFVFFRPFNFDGEKNSSLPMLELLETEWKKLLEIRFKKMIWISTRQFISVHSHQCLKSVIGDTAFGYEALKTGVIRAAESGSFALCFRYFINDKASLVEVIGNQSGLYQPIQETDACIITKLGSPYDNTKKHSFIADLVFKIPNLKSVFKIRKYLFIYGPIQGMIDSIEQYRYHEDQRHLSKKYRGHCSNPKL
ncbi:STAS domain-containing protein [Mucor velutinosus]|uniref:STAS domain-containing protein n=1 Tax=Mucor velutinosus TaxID=708070 RepID=A0AAN7I414_9FUNG|nr:STAS domain-containing protein [Mucor velutinosus]